MVAITPVAVNRTPTTNLDMGSIRKHIHGVMGLGNTSTVEVVGWATHRTERKGLGVKVGIKHHTTHDAGWREGGAGGLVSRTWPANRPRCGTYFMNRGLGLAYPASSVDVEKPRWACKDTGK
jgi:hypothetical protein